MFAYLDEKSIVHPNMFCNYPQPNMYTCKKLKDEQHWKIKSSNLNIPTDNPIIDLFIYQRPKLQVQPTNEDELKDPKYNNKESYLLTSVGVKWLLLR